MPKHPREVLFAGERAIPVIPACEHFAGQEKLITRALDRSHWRRNEAASLLGVDRKTLFRKMKELGI